MPTNDPTHISDLHVLFGLIAVATVLALIFS